MANRKIEQLFNVIRYQTERGNIIPKIFVEGYDTTIWPQFEAIIENIGLRKKFWDENHEKLNRMGIEMRQSLVDFETYYDLGNYDGLTPVQQAQVIALKAQGWVEKPLVNGVCTPDTGYEKKEFKKDNTVIYCLQKIQNTGYPLATSQPFYCVRNQKYYSMKISLVNSFHKNRLCQTLKVDGVLYLLCYNYEEPNIDGGIAELLDGDNEIRMKGKWACANQYEYVVVLGDKDGKGKIQTLNFRVDATKKVSGN